jgi:hypothetical protein
VREPLDIPVPRRGKALDRSFVNALEEEDSRVVFSHGQILSRS